MAKVKVAMQASGPKPAWKPIRINLNNMPDLFLEQITPGMLEKRHRELSEWFAMLWKTAEMNQSELRVLAALYEKLYGKPIPNDGRPISGEHIAEVANFLDDQLRERYPE